MSERIEVGDLVMVVRGNTCCGYTGPNGGVVGVVFVVTGFTKNALGACIGCSTISDIQGAYGMSDGESVDLDRLRKIPPLTEPETVIEEAVAWTVCNRLQNQKLQISSHRNQQKTRRSGF